MRNWKQTEIAEIAVMLKQGMGARQIADMFEGRSKSSVISLINRTPELKAIGFQHTDLGGTRTADIDEAKVHEMREAGFSWKSIAEKLGVSTTTLRRRVDVKYRAVASKGNAKKREAHKHSGIIDAGLKDMVGRISRQEWLQRLEGAPRDTRDLTGRIFNDPIPHDPRTPWRPSSAGYEEIRR